MGYISKIKCLEAFNNTFQKLKIPETLTIHTLFNEYQILKSPIIYKEKQNHKRLAYFKTI